MKRLVAAALLISGLAHADLETKRMQKDYETKKIPEAVKKVKDKCGADIRIDVDWKTFTARDAFSYFDFAITHSVAALEDICKDDLGKDGVKKDVKAIKIVNVETRDAVKVSFDKGQLNIAYNFKDGGSGTAGWGAVKRAIEEKL